MSSLLAAANIAKHLAPLDDNPDAALRPLAAAPTTTSSSSSPPPARSHKGVLDAWRRPKETYATMAAIYGKN